MDPGSKDQIFWETSLKDATITLDRMQHEGHHLVISPQLFSTQQLDLISCHRQKRGERAHISQNFYEHRALQSFSLLQPQLGHVVDREQDRLGPSCSIPNQGSLET